MGFKLNFFKGGGGELGKRDQFRWSWEVWMSMQDLLNSFLCLLPFWRGAGKGKGLLLVVTEQRTWLDFWWCRVLFRGKSR